MAAIFPLVVASAVLPLLLILPFPSAKAASLVTTGEVERAEIQPEDPKSEAWKALAKQAANKVFEAVKECAICRVFKYTCNNVAA
ncbi:hypothetical protein TSMEX_002994 [Taenia solium]|eukprot:TsM_000951200 transcript=TsM_000951200 gene=TsM_000951200